MNIFLGIYKLCKKIYHLLLVFFPLHGILCQNLISNYTPGKECLTGVAPGGRESYVSDGVQQSCLVLLDIKTASLSAFGD